MLIDSASIYCTTRHPDGRVSGVPPHCSSCGHWSKTESPIGRHQMSARLSRTSPHWVCTHSFFQQSSGPHISYTRSVHTPFFSKRSSGNAPVHYFKTRSFMTPFVWFFLSLFFSFFFLVFLSFFFSFLWSLSLFSFSSFLFFNVCHFLL